MSTQKEKKSKIGRQKVWTGEVIDKFLTSNGSTIKRVTKQFKNVKSRIRWGCGLCGNEWIGTFDGIYRKVLRGKIPKGCPHCGWTEETVYHDFLDEISHRSAYFLGIFRARGSFTKNTVITSVKDGQIVITSDSLDKMEKIQRLISSNCKVKEKGDSFKIEIYSPKMLQKLKEYKALVNGKKPKSIPKVIRDNPKFFPDFLRGYFDCVGYVELLRNGDRLYDCRVNISVSHSFAKSIKHFYKVGAGNNKSLGYVTKRIINDNERTELHINGTYSSYKFLKWIYNSSVSPIKYMSHKNYNKFLELQAILTLRAERNRKVAELLRDYDNIRKEVKKRPTVKDFVKRYGVSDSQVRKVAQGKNTRGINKKAQQVIRDERGKVTRLKQDMNLIVQDAITRTHLTGDSFRSLAIRWKDYEKYTNKITDFEHLMDEDSEDQF